MKKVTTRKAAPRPPRPEVDTPSFATVAGPSVATLGEAVRERRRERELTLEELATAAGVSSGLLSQLERGLGNPSFNTLVQVAHALSVPVTALFPPEPARSPVVRANERRRLAAHGLRDATANFVLTAHGSRALEAILVEVPAGHSTEATPFVHEGEEFGFIIEGEQEVHLGGDVYLLREGDSITYSSRIPHWYRNPSSAVSRAIWVVTPPSW